MRRCGEGRAPRDAAVVARKRLPVGFGNVRDGGGGGYLEMLQLALANGCPWDERACTMAARGGHLEVVLALIEVGADVNADLPPNFSSEVYRATPLYYAVEGDHEAIMRALIGAGADVNTTNQESETPLFCAAKDGHETMVRALIEASADVNKAMDIGAMPLYIADREGRLFRFSPRPARCDEGTAWVYCSQPARKRTAHATRTRSEERVETSARRSTMYRNVLIPCSRCFSGCARTAARGTGTCVWTVQWVMTHRRY